MIVVWRVVDSCNLSCPFCAFDRRLDFPRSQADPSEVVRIAGLLADYQQRTGDPVLISWLGGEPLLWAPLEALTHAVRALGLQVSATTNGTTLGRARTREHILNNYRELTVSIDGFPVLHDFLRGWPGGFGKLRHRIGLLASEAGDRRSGLRLRANIVLMHDNVAAFETLCLEIASWGIAEITFNQLGGRDRPEFYPDHRLQPGDIDRLAAFLPALRRRLAGQDVMLVGGDAYLERIRASTMNTPNPVEDCRPAQEFLFIDERGRLAPCSFTTDEYGLDIGSLATASDILALPATFRAARRRRRSPQCDDCLSTQVCEKFSRPAPRAEPSVGDDRRIVPQLAPGGQ